MGDAALVAEAEAEAETEAARRRTLCLPVECFEWRETTVAILNRETDFSMRRTAPPGRR